MRRKRKREKKREEMRDIFYPQQETLEREKLVLCFFCFFFRFESHTFDQKVVILLVVLTIRDSAPEL